MSPRLAWALALGWMALIALLSHQSAVGGLATASGLPLADKLDHLVEFALLGALLRNAVARHHPLPVVAPAFFVLALGASYGALDELHQSLVPGRDAELGDWLADAAGVALGSFAFSRYE
ncbi:MAG: VanZ family protein [Candidatus Poseidoniia archaeon]|nr:VanZ family protein [Candidatus Poseidoniia archaeon]MDP7007448.1 VanZ family protein [Candidatus Poseidoniia archaeon]